MIDRLRTQIQERLDQLLAEADKLRHALIAVDPRGNTSSADKKASPPARPTSRNERDRTRLPAPDPWSLVGAAAAEG